MYPVAGSVYVSLPWATTWAWSSSMSGGREEVGGGGVAIFFPQWLGLLAGKRVVLRMGLRGSCLCGCDGGGWVGQG